MKILMLNEADTEGGAARAATRLHRSLVNAGVDSRMLVQLKKGDDPRVIGPSKAGKLFSSLRPKLDAYPIRLAYKIDKFQSFSPAWLPDFQGAVVHKLAPEIIHLHWINGGFLRAKSLAKLGGPLVWTLHDMWAFTGGCHYDGECGRYTQACGKCPQLHSSNANDPSRWILARKAKAWADLPLTLITPSRWMASCARASALFRNTRIEVIPNGLDLNRYRPVDKTLARNILGLPINKDLILFGSLSTDDYRKGFTHLKTALGLFAGQPAANKTELVVFGSGRPVNPQDLGLPIHYSGRLYDDISLALLYAAADIFVSPSVQDNLPNTVMEAMACGTPCVAFRIGGMEDLIDHEKNGYLAKPFDAKDLADGLLAMLSDSGRRIDFGSNARKKAESLWGEASLSLSHLELYADLLGRVNSKK